MREPRLTQVHKHLADELATVANRDGFEVFYAVVFEALRRRQQVRCLPLGGRIAVRLVNGEETYPPF